MIFTSDTASDGVRERHLAIKEFSGILWTPDDPTARPSGIVLLGHGGGQDKGSPAIRARALHFLHAHGLSALSIDAPGNGDRPVTDRDERFFAGMRELMDAGAPVTDHLTQYYRELVPEAVADWSSTLDALEKDGISAGARIGYWGVSLGAALGVPLIARDSRIDAGVVGLIGLDAIADDAAQVTVPIEFLVQWDDQLVARESALAAYDALGSSEKALHANPGPHGGIPAYEIESAGWFFQRHLAQPQG